MQHSSLGAEQRLLVMSAAAVLLQHTLIGDVIERLRSVQPELGGSADAGGGAVGEDAAAAGWRDCRAPAAGCGGGRTGKQR